MKRQFLAIPLLLITFVFLFWTKSFAATCQTNLECVVDHTKEGCQLSSDGTTYECESPIYSKIVPTATDPFCIQGDESSGINTALGCIKVGSGNDLITSILRLATGLGGGIALALILYGVFIVTTSAGMPDKLKAGSEIITSAVIGLIFILLSIFLVNLIGINILGIPGLS